MEACTRTGPIAVFKGAIDAQARVAYIQALTAAEAADRAAGNTDAVRNNGAEHYIHNDHLDVALNLVLTNYLTRKVLARVKRSMRRDMRKPADMKVRTTTRTSSV